MTRTMPLPMPTPPACTVRDVVDLYLRHSRAIGLHCPRAYSEQEVTLGAFVAHLGDLPVSECKPFHLSDWVESQPGWKSLSTKRKRASSVKAAFNWACEGERIDRNPFRSVKYGEAERRPDMPEEIFEQLCAAASKPYERALRFMRLTGCRLGEMCEALWKDMDFARGIWTIKKHKSRRFKRREKVVALIPEAVDLLRSIIYAEATALFVNVDLNAVRVNPDSEVFRNTQGTAWSTTAMGRNFARLRKKFKKRGIEIAATMHGIRHRWASCAVANGAPIKLVSHQMGHASVSTTEAYYCDLSGEIEAVRAAAGLAIPQKKIS